MSLLRVIQPEGWKRPKGYSNGILAKGRILFVGGQIGWDENYEFQSDDFGEQWDRALANVLAVVRAAGGGPEHIARMTVYVTDKKLYQAAADAVGASWRKHMGKHFPAMALVQVADLLEDRALVEIEATCVLPEEE
ncbi:MAG TPA: RidA family protein [Fredinandcohnia sp.]|nr:RidA family protein [Fredinandcohnia sp.]